MRKYNEVSDVPRAILAISAADIICSTDTNVPRIQPAGLSGSRVVLADSPWHPVFPLGLRGPSEDPALASLPEPPRRGRPVFPLASGIP